MNAMRIEKATIRGYKIPNNRYLNEKATSLGLFRQPMVAHRLIRVLTN